MGVFPEGTFFMWKLKLPLLHPAQTEIISLMWVCTVMWSSFRWEQIYAEKSKGNGRSRRLLDSV